MIAGTTHARETLQLCDGFLRIVVVADTHSCPHGMSVSRIAAEKPGHIVHAGDIGHRSVLDSLGSLAPVSAVRGNIDERASDLPDSLLLEVRDSDRELASMLVLYIGLNGIKLRTDVVRLAEHHRASMVLCGHSHVPFAGRDRGLTVFNPGSIGPRRFSLPIVFGVMELRRDRIDLRHVDCENGETWRPGRSNGGPTGTP